MPTSRRLNWLTCASASRVLERWTCMAAIANARAEIAGFTMGTGQTLSLFTAAKRHPATS